MPGLGRSPGGGLATHSSILACEFLGQRSLTSCSPWGCKESDTTKRLKDTLSLEDRISQFSPVAQSCPTLCNPTDCSMPGFLSITNSRSLLKLMSIESVMPSNHLILCCPLLLLPSIFSSIRVFSDDSVLHIRWPKYWSFSFNISPSNEYSGLVSFRMDRLDLLVL